MQHKNKGSALDILVTEQMSPVKESCTEAGASGDHVVPETTISGNAKALAGYISEDRRREERKGSLSDFVSSDDGIECRSDEQGSFTGEEKKETLSGFAAFSAFSSFKDDPLTNAFVKNSSVSDTLQQKKSSLRDLSFTSEIAAGINFKDGKGTEGESGSFVEGQKERQDAADVFSLFQSVKTAPADPHISNSTDTISSQRKTGGINPTAVFDSFSAAASSFSDAFAAYSGALEEKQSILSSPYDAENDSTEAQPGDIPLTQEAQEAKESSRQHQHDTVSKNDLQMKCGFIPHASLPGNILYDAETDTVIIDHPAASFLGFFEKPEQLQKEADDLASDREAKEAADDESAMYIHNDLMMHELLKKDEYRGFTDPAAITRETGLRSFLRLLGRDIVSSVLFHVRQLSPAPVCIKPGVCSIDLCSNNRTLEARKKRNCPFCRKHDDGSPLYNTGITDCISFELCMDRGPYAGNGIYIRVSAFYNENNRPYCFTFTLSQQTDRMFAVTPDEVINVSNFDWDVVSDQILFGKSYFKMLGYSAKDISTLPKTATHWSMVMPHPDDRQKIQSFLYQMTNTGGSDCVEMYYRTRKADGNYIWTKETMVATARNKNGRALRIIGTCANINHVVDSYEKIRTRIYTDVLTGLKNRAYMLSKLPVLLHPAMQPLGIIFVDATALKVYNDYLSHSSGDRLLITLTTILSQSLPDPKELVRLSGDEFLCLVPKCNSEHMAHIEQLLLKARHQYNLKAPVRMPVFFSFGSSSLDLNNALYNARKNLSQLPPDEGVPSSFLSSAKELFYMAVQSADLQMQYYKKKNKSQHYDLIKTYIESVLKYSITLTDSRITFPVN